MKEKNIGFISNDIYIIEKSGYAENVPAFSGGDCLGIFAGGDNSFIACIENAEYSDISRYINTLEQSGYTKVAENKIDDNLFYSYGNGSNLVYFYYINSLKTVRLIAELFYDFSYDEPFEDTAAPAVITSSACDRNYYIRLPNNKLAVIDGGWRIEDWSRYEPQELLEAMYKEMSEVCGRAKVEISLWIITHAHTDHVRVLEYLYKMPFAENIVIDRIIYNFPDEAHLDDGPEIPNEKVSAAAKQLKEWQGKAGKDFPYEEIFYNCPFPVYDTFHYEFVCREAFTHYKAVKIKAHDGMKFNLSGVIFEVLHTPDDDMPTIYKNKNDTSLVIKMTYLNTSALWLGDMGVVPGDSCMKMYGDYLKCNAVQVSHHGWGSASWDFFKLLSPEILLWNNSEFGFQYADKYQGYGKTESSTRLFNMPCVKENYFCNTVKMQYIPLPFAVKEETNAESEYKLLVSAASDQTFMLNIGNGKLIMINGGWREEMWNKYDHSVLLNNLFGEMQKLSGNDNVTVAAWFLTDANPSNNQFLAHFKECDFSDKLVIENIIYNFPDFKNMFCESGLKKAAESFVSEIEALQGNHITAKIGEKFDFGNVQAQILYAPECESFKSLRDASSVVMLNVKNNKIIFTGDMNDRISSNILENRKDIKCDIIQVANHGLNDGGLLDFYVKCGAKIQLWNTGEYAYRFFSPTEGYEKSKVSTEVYNLPTCERNYFCDRILPQIISLPVEQMCNQAK